EKATAFSRRGEQDRPSLCPFFCKRYFANVPVERLQRIFLQYYSGCHKRKMAPANSLVSLAVRLGTHRRCCLYCVRFVDILNFRNRNFYLYFFSGDAFAVLNCACLSGVSSFFLC
ncbi:MAG: hypothetical protein ACI4XB_07065, partial [Ruminococcus sp.]